MDEPFEELLNKPEGLLPVADAENGDICVVLLKATASPTCSPSKIIKMGRTPVVVDDEEECCSCDFVSTLCD
jgi:hypothetical protein